MPRRSPLIHAATKHACLGAALSKLTSSPVITDPLFYLLAIPAVTFLGLSKGGFAGLGMLATPLLALVVPPLEARGDPAADPDLPGRHFGVDLSPARGAPGI